MARQKRETSPETQALGEKLGKTINRLRQADKLSLGELSDMSGVAKSMISQIEKNETNPTLATLSRLSSAPGTSVEAVLGPVDDKANLVAHTRVKDTPVLKSEDGLCELRIIGSIDTVQWAQWYDFKAQPNGVLESDPHPAGTIENLSVLTGELEVTIGDQSWSVKTGETLRYHADREHKIVNKRDTIAHATMVNLVANAR